MKSFKMYASSINERYLDELAEILRRGGVIIYPTDSLYAIGCDALSNRAVERVCRLKNINPAKQRLSMVCSSISQASEYARIDNEAFRLLRANLPGPFTFILPASTKLAKAFKGRHEVGLRVPDNPIAQRIAETLGNPILSSSVGAPPADTFDASPRGSSVGASHRGDSAGASPFSTDHIVVHPDEIMLMFENDIDAMVDGGTVPGTPTAIIDLTDTAAPQILRDGPLPLTE
jgi:tRNA threonylcarbamoyl adenosine modification protein (Sua5/YciO/YrdC/YwlC family)